MYGQSKFNVLSVDSVNLGLQHKFLQAFKWLESRIDWESPTPLHPFIIWANLMHRLNNNWLNIKNELLPLWLSQVGPLVLFGPSGLTKWYVDHPFLLKGNVARSPPGFNVASR